MTDRPASKLRPGFVAAAALALVLTVSALSDSAVARNRARHIGHATAGLARIGDEVRFSGDGFERTWRVVDSFPDGLLLRRGDDLSYVDPHEVVRAE